MWKRIGLSDEEWEECRRAALEMSLASGTRVPPRQVAVEFALARSVDATPAPGASREPPAGAFIFARGP